MLEASPAPLLSSAKPKFLSNLSLTLLPPWTVCALGAVIAAPFSSAGPTNSTAWLPAALCFVVLWFSLQLDLLRCYAPSADARGWLAASVIGFVLVSLSAGFVVYFGGTVLIPIGATSDNRLATPSAAAGLGVGFILLGLVQAIAIRGYVQSAWWWALALAWVPPYLLLLGYTTLIGDFAGAALPDATTSYRTVVGEALLLITPLGLFWLLARHPKPTAPRPRGYVDSEPLEETATQPVESGPQMRGVLLLPLAVAGAALALYWLAYTSLVERTWIEPGDATYLRFAADRIVTAPQQDEQWDKQQLLADSTLDGAIRVRLVSKLEIYSGADANSTKSFNVENLNKNRVGRTKINIVRLSPDGKLVATGTGAFHSGESAWYVASDHAVHIWSLADGAELYQLTEPHAPVHAIAWSPDGRYLAAGSGLEDIEGSWAFSIDYDPVVRVWLMDGAKPELVKVFTGHSDAIEALAWSEDSRHLASRDLDNRIVVWKVS